MNSALKFTDATDQQLVIDCIIQRRNEAVRNLNNLPEGADNARSIFQQEIDSVNSLLDVVNRQMKTAY